MLTDIREGRVIWDPARSLWFATVALVAVAGAVPAAIRSPSAVVLFVVTSIVTLCAGHSVGIHRGLIHRAYRVPVWLEHALVHRQPLWRDYFWNLHCRFAFAAPFDPHLDPRIERDPVYRFLERTWRWQQLPWALLLLALGGWPWLIWGTFVRVTVGTTGHWFVGNVAHRTG